MARTTFIGLKAAIPGKFEWHNKKLPGGGTFFAPNSCKEVGRQSISLRFGDKI